MHDLEHPAFEYLKRLPQTAAFNRGRRDGLINTLNGIVVRSGLTSDDLLGDGGMFSRTAPRACLYVHVGGGNESRLDDADAWRLVRAWRLQAASTGLPLRADPDLEARLAQHLGD